MADLNKILIEFTEFLELHGAEGIRKGVEMYIEEFERTNDTVKDHLFMIDILKGEQSEKERLQDEIDDLRIDIKELVSVLTLLHKEANELRIHTADQFLIDWEDESIEGTKQFTKALDDAYKTINKWQ